MYQEKSGNPDDGPSNGYKHTLSIILDSIYLKDWILRLAVFRVSEATLERL
jgi:hypothetical protein